MFKLSNTFIALMLFISIVVISICSTILIVNKNYMISTNTQEVTFTITHGSSISSISDKKRRAVSNCTALAFYSASGFSAAMVFLILFPSYPALTACR